MRIKTTYKLAFILTATLLKEVGNNDPYSMELVDLDPSQDFQNTPYRIGKMVSMSYDDGKFRAPTSILRTKSGRSVTRISIGCQTFEGANARALIKAVKAARAKAKRKSK